jgi:hypothetical protein
MSHEFAFDLGDWFRDNAEQVRRDLARYFGGGDDAFTGRWFERFAALGDPDRFEPSDIVAVESLSVEVRSESAAKLIFTEADRFNGLLQQIPWGADLWNVPRSVIEHGSAADRLHAALRNLDRVDWVTAGKLMAAKRPRLIPVFDNKVKDLLRPPKGQFWVTLYDELKDEARRRAIQQVCSEAPPHVSLLRRIDVALWMAR